jgi:hypothetical protein
MNAPRSVNPNPYSPEKEERTANGLMIFAVISSVVVVVVIIALIVVMFSVAQENVISPVAGPYNLPSRPVPDATTAEALFPPQLGRFQRETLSGSLDDFQASYSSGADRIAIQGSHAVSYAAAQLGVTQVFDQFGPANIMQRIGMGDSRYSFYLSQVEGGVRYAWNHLEWFFDIQASSRQALDDFMDSFQY